MKIINVKTASKKLKEGNSILLDVRTGAEFEEVHAKGAIHLPLDKIEDFKDNIKNSKKDILVICKSGQRSQMACNKIKSIESTHIYNVEGGTLAWIQNDLNVVEGKPKWDLERQVRFVAGSLVLIGAILGLFVSKYFIYLSGFVGAGLVFASVTNTCTMGMMLMKLPYNKSKDLSVERINKILAA